ncbi:glucuronate isomerase [Cytobacillus oceanisediminis]|uniref:Uronate isomerase n=1 Tax=Cytobacillus oceanisediminis TaxID=665099 RepID=A0A562JIK3_9BACI|nr:glucuronate isomerase [Cytobacillus oceanisediminis]TWH82971.1 glucuronate isomerase [Cytobacillus oceanisediminis]
MKSFLDDHFLLNTDTAILLYEKAAKGLPIFDFHCHLIPQEVWENKSFKNITQLWLGGDHYKWRTMRMHGIGEQFITGDASDWEKFSAWAETVPRLIGNPLYHWTHMELKMFFGIEKVLSPETAREIYDECNEKLQDPAFTPRALIEKAHVKFIGTTDDPVSTLGYHRLLKNDESFQTMIAPTFRPDGAFFIERPTFESWIEKLSEVSGIKINSLDQFLAALRQRVDYFHENGGRASDHDIQRMEYVETAKEEVEAIFTKRMRGDKLSDGELVSYRSFLLKELGKMYAEKQWVMQLHMGAMRNNNTRMKKLIGSDAGFDSIGESNFAEGLSRFLDALDQENALPRTVLFNLNPKDNAVLAAMMGNFYEEGVPGKIQFGSGWWFNDHIDGMEKQMKDLANVGLLSHFIGMLTDSRSFLSYARHDYFRRILCNILGEWAEKGMAPNDMELLKSMVGNIGYQNAERYFLER